MIRKLIRLTGFVCFLIVAYQGYLKFTEQPSTNTNPTETRVGTIVRGNGDGSETVVWERR